MAGRV
jgi:hypothetical protein